MILKFRLLTDLGFVGMVSAILFQAPVAQAAASCNLVFDKCPGDFASGTITVPQSVIWLDPAIPFCAENAQVQTGTNAAIPSIVFIIDNSGSMSKDGGNGGNDPQQARFSKVSELLDIMNTTLPATEVGLVIFTRRLQFDDRDNPYFKPAFPNDPTQHDAYVPLTALNRTFPGTSMKGLDTLKALLKYHGKGNLDYATTRPNARPNTSSDSLNTRDGTDISLGFEAAKVAMLASKAAKGNQYFIFLSDGEPTGYDTPRNDSAMNFKKGIGAPATFTIFFKAGNDANPPAPQTIIEMTENIKANGYSASNPKSAYWAINLPGTQLLELLQSNVLNPIFSNTPTTPKNASLTVVGGATYDNSALDAKNFVFPKRIPLAPDQTSIALSYVYAYTDSGIAKTKTVPYTLTVKRSGAGALATGLSSSCKESADITLTYNGTPITRVTADHNNLDVHVALQAGTVCTGCQVSVSPNKSSDKETIALLPVGGIPSGNFKRETSTLIAPQDGRLQHLPTDSIVVLWTNPENALDIVRKSFPYTDIGTALQVIDHNNVAKIDEQIPIIPGEHFLLVAPAALAATPGSGLPKNWSIMPGPLSIKDSGQYVGIGIEASRAFKVSISIYTNLGQFVNRIEMGLSQTEFDKLSKGIKNNTRVIRVLWKSRSQDGSLVGTGAYILKTDVTLLRIPGIAEDQIVRSDYRIVGVLRSN